jgi:iron complex outermembrane receptor protein
MLTFIKIIVNKEESMRIGIKDSGRVKNFSFWGLLGGAVFLSGQGEALSQSEIELKEVEITAPAVKEPPERLSQEVRILSGKLLESLGTSIYSSLDLRERGGFGVQEDLSIRGTTFEQNLVLFEGIRVSDLQTGHHLMNLPFTTKNLSALEILPGGASPLYGAGGFGGALNFLLKPSQRGINFSADLGSYDFKSVYLQGGFPIGNRTFSLTLDSKKSNGFIENRDFDLRSFNLYTKDKEMTLFYGFTEKDFGARNFYTPRFDNEFEETRTHLFLIKKSLVLNNLFLEPALLYRKNYDYYILDRQKPSFYQNQHQTYLYRINIPGALETERALYLFGIETGYERLKSSRLGEYLRRNLSFYTGVKPKISEKWHPSLQLRYDLNVEEKDFLSLGSGLAYNLKPGLKLRTAFNYSYRLPSVTELRYQSLGIKGNPDLSVEKSLNLEGGFDFQRHDLTLSGTLFFRKGDNLIDWIFNGTSSSAENTDVKTLGFILHTEKNWKGHTFLFSYTYLNQKGRDIEKSRYYGNYLRHGASLGGIWRLPRETNLNLLLQYQKRLNQRGIYVLDFEWEKPVGKNLKFAIWGKNLLDEKYYEIFYPEAKKGVSGIPQWFGIRVEGGF